MGGGWVFSGCIMFVGLLALGSSWSFCLKIVVGYSLFVSVSYFVMRPSRRLLSIVSSGGSSTCSTGLGLYSLCALCFVWSTQLVGREPLPGSLARLHKNWSLSCPFPRDSWQTQPLFAGSSLKSLTILSLFSLTSLGIQDLRECLFLSDVEKFLAVEKAPFLVGNLRNAVGLRASGPLKEISGPCSRMSLLRSGRVF